MQNQQFFVLISAASLSLIIACGSAPSGPKPTSQDQKGKSKSAEQTAETADESTMDVPSKIPTQTGTSTNTDSSNPPSTQSLVQVEASCLAGQSFRLSIRDAQNINNLSDSAFPGCDRIANKLNGQSYPKGMVSNVLTGGSIIEASCAQSSLTIRIRYNGNNSNTSMSLDSNAACLEIRDAINAERI